MLLAMRIDEPLWTPERVEAELQDAGKVMAGIPLGPRFRPVGARSGMPEIIRTLEDLNTLLARETGETAHDIQFRKSRFEEERNRWQIQHTAREVDRAYETVEWLYYILDPVKRKVVAARTLMRKPVPYRHLAEEFHTSHETVRTWYRWGLDQIVRGLKPHIAPT